MARSAIPERRDAQVPIKSPIPSLVDFIASDSHREAVISFPPSTEDNVGQYRSLHPRFAAHEIERLLRAIDSHKYKFCGRLHQQSLLILCGVVTYSEPCGARHRGFYLIAESLHPVSRDDALLTARQYSNKRRLGGVLPQLLKGIALRSESEEARRWMGVLTLELLEDCPENVKALTPTRDHQWVGLTDVLKHGKCEILRLLTGSIVRQMLSDGIPVESFWKAGEIRDLVTKFPVAAQQDTQWIDGFEHYVQDMATESILSQARSSVSFARAAIIGNQRYDVVDNSVILVTVSRPLLQLFVQTSPNELAMHIDIALKNISSHSLISSANTQLGESMHTIHIELRSPTGVTHFVNAAARHEQIVELTFNSNDVISNLMRLLSLEAVVQDEFDLVNPVDHVASALSQATSLALLKDQLSISDSQPRLQSSQQTLQDRRGQGPTASKNKEHMPLDAIGSASAAHRDGEIFHPRKSQKRVEIRHVFTSAAVVRPSSQPKVATKRSAGQSKPSRVKRKGTEEQDAYDIPPSPPPLKTLSHAKHAQKPANKKKRKERSANTVPDTDQATRRSVERPNTPIETPVPLLQSKFRRTAAINANKKIRGMVNLNSKIHSLEGQDEAQKSKVRLQHNSPLELHEASAEDQFDTKETAEGADEAIIAPKKSTQDAIESVNKDNNTYLQRDNPDHKIVVTKSKNTKGNYDFGAIKDSIHKGVVNSHIMEIENHAVDGQNNVKKSVPKTYQQTSPPDQMQTILVETMAEQDRTSLASNISRKATKEESILSNAQDHASSSRSSRDRDPFAMKLTAAVANEEAPRLKNGNPRTLPAKNGSNPRKSDQEGDPALGGSILKRISRALITPSSHTFDAAAQEPTKRLKWKSQLEPELRPKNAKAPSPEIANPIASAEKTPPLASRKTTIISFSISGPRNQGTARGKAWRARPQASSAKSAVSIDDFGEANDVHGTIELPKFSASTHIQQKPFQQEKSAEKHEGARMAHALAEPFNLVDQQEPIIHRQNRNTQREDVERPAFKPSSQSTRVDPNGSPMPARHPTNGPVFIPKFNTVLEDETERPRSDQQDFINGEETFLTNDEGEAAAKDEEMVQPKLPLRNNVSPSSIPQSGAHEWVNVSMNKKQIPSSPHAPSVTSALPIHHIYRSGEIVNPRTEETIVRCNPQDPFVGEASRFSTFTHLLRMATEIGTKRPAEPSINIRSKKARLYIGASRPEDPDKTLVEPTDIPRESKVVEYEEASSSSSPEDTSEESISPTVNNKDDEDTPTQWKNALRPHQQNVLGVLTEISHRLLAHLIKNEDALIDMIADFQKNGTLLIDHLEKEQQAESMAQAANVEALEKKVTALYQKTSNDLRNQADKVVGCTEKVEKEWKANQQAMLAAADAALAVCSAI